MTTQDSAERASMIAHPPVVQRANVIHGKVRIMAFNFTQVGTGTAASIARLVDLPSGRVTYLAGSSFFKWSAMGSARVMDIGWAAYRDKSGVVVAASLNGIHDDLNVAAAGSSVALHSALVNGYKEFESSTGVTITAQVNAGTLPAAATINGYVMYTVE